jgi:hypothetical protein
MSEGGFDVVIGNPPYVEYHSGGAVKILGFLTIACGDLYAFVMERALHCLSHNGLFGMIVPISMFCTDGFISLQELTKKSFLNIWLSFFANRPSQLFDGAQKRLTIIIGNKRDNSNISKIYSSNYLRWKKEERETLLSGKLTFNQRPSGIKSLMHGSMEKIGNPMLWDILRKILKQNKKIEHYENQHGKYILYYMRKFSYFLSFLDVAPTVKSLADDTFRLPTELKLLKFSDRKERDLIILFLSSSTFFWFWNIFSDCRNLNKRDLLVFPVNLETIQSKFLFERSAKFIEKLKITSRTMIKSGLSIETFDYKKCKDEIDQIDSLLAKIYNFTDEELDFIINYDIKYRMGGSDDGE